MPLEPRQLAELLLMPGSPDAVAAAVEAAVLSAGAPDNYGVVVVVAADFLAECGPWLDHPRSWSPNLEFYPDKIVRALSAMAAAEAPVLTHCAGGRDRTGMIGSTLLALAGGSDSCGSVRPTRAWAADPATVLARSDAATASASGS